MVATPTTSASPCRPTSRWKAIRTACASYSPTSSPTADGTTVLVDAHEDENQGTIVTNVVNFGSQIAPSDRLDIFRRFVKGKTGPGTESGGTGLGLSIARWAAQLHGGTVKVVDDTRGADFEIILPKYHIAER